jgi:hypothetical protein
MALTVSLTGDWLGSAGNARTSRGTITFDSSYAVGGEALTPSMLGLGRIDALQFDNPSVYFNRTTSRLLSYTTGGGIASVSRQNLQGADADVADADTTDQNAGPTNDDYIDTFAAIAAGAWAYTENLEIDAARNVGITLYNDSGGALSMEEGATSFLVTGVFRGEAQTDTITFTLGALTKEIANTKYRWAYGVKPFDTITSVVATGITANQNGIKVGVGLGRKLGLPVDPEGGVAAGILKVTKGSANVAVGTYNNTHKTLDQGAIGANDDFDITIKTGSLGVEAVTGADLSGLTVGFFAVGA